MYDRHDFGCRCNRIDGFAMEGATPQYPPDQVLEPKHLSVTLRPNIADRTCEATVTHTLLARGPSADTITLNGVAFNDLRCTDEDAHLTYDGTTIEVRFDKAVPAGETRELHLTYRIVKPTAGMYFGAPDTQYPDAPLYVATDNETERARHWLATVDLPHVRPTLAFALTVPTGHSALANGALLSDVDNNDGTHTVSWRLDSPCPSYLTCVAMGDLIKQEDGEFKGIPIAYFGAAPHAPEDLKRSFGRTADMLNWMTAKLGVDFPYPKYFQFALPNFGGAMENISLVAWDDIFVMDENLAKEWTRLVDQVNVHEMAHSYFGDLVVCRDFAHAWLKESWATFMEQCWFEDDLGADEGLYEYYMNAHAYFSEADDSYKRPLVTRTFNSSWDMYDRHLYPGGGCRLHTLRAHLTPSVFWAGVSSYLQEFSNRNVETADFRKALERESGRSLVRFFDEWIHGTGYPDIKVTFAYDAGKKRGTFEVEQQQVDKKTGEGAFHFACKLGWMTGDDVCAKSIEISEKKHTFAFAMDADPEQVRFDIDSEVLHKLSFNSGDAKLRKQLTDAKDVIGRIVAGKELAATGTQANIDLIGAAYASEAFWGVRAEWARAIGDLHTQQAVELLASWVTSEANPMTQHVLFATAGKFRDPAICDALTARVNAGDLTPRAAAAAYESLGKQRENAPVELLIDAAKKSVDAAGFAQSGALKGLAASRSEKARPHLRDALPYGTSPQKVRPIAARAFAASNALERGAPRRESIETLVDLLRDPSDRMRNGAIDGLVVLGASAASGAIRSSAAALSNQEQVEVRRKLTRLSKADPDRSRALEKSVDSLTEQLRKLQAVVDGLSATAKADAEAASKAAADADKNK